MASLFGKYLTTPAALSLSRSPCIVAPSPCIAKAPRGLAPSKRATVILEARKGKSKRPEDAEEVPPENGQPEAPPPPEEPSPEASAAPAEQEGPTSEPSAEPPAAEASAPVEPPPAPEAAPAAPQPEPAQPSAASASEVEPSMEDYKDLAQLDGKWDLAYTSNSGLIGILALDQVLPLVTVGDVFQTIDTSSGTVENQINIEVPVGRTALSAKSTFELKQALNPVKSTVDSVFEQVNSLAAQAPQLAVPLQSDAAQTWQLNTFLDKDMRISRGDGGSIFVYCRSSTA
ncbi:hypothetical protein DUNSADRAFT_11242 [Dunaliella salina]|uniref:Plastid lipid-associated protein/fibrillin conserved domain-containing protein n=1 Tax=Dunaliella salina TaxID=3046 RepID=A0ABQ7GDR6_DUNSA|nr:hypothetical protein DUNSADRAFT_11242 [Dunaliella salina]|eukprot:KAF5832755.1 hypothetical protein DUNSADRAFT_11242 [Dunaliella salina]